MLFTLLSLTNLLDLTIILKQSELWSIVQETCENGGFIKLPFLIYNRALITFF